MSKELNDGQRRKPGASAIKPRFNGVIADEFDNGKECYRPQQHGPTWINRDRQRQRED
jgi:hypothetical protein